ncbi:MlaD family protein [Pararhodobacter sp.]|uniref:MlaD family protein n=1 Tax=Pararhodobacter sp. TaxID=2127056 RepID=UPI002FDD4D04
METRASYILVGVFTLLSILAGLGFTLWLAKVQLDRTYSQYDILFESVAGLGQASAVRYNGVDVGQVLTIALDDENPSLVRVRIEIDATTPVRTDTTATLSSQGVTGVSFVALEGGSAESARLVADPSEDVPVITSRPSLVQGLMTDAPDLLAEAISLMRDIRDFTTPANSAAIASILSNVESATSRIDTMAQRIDSIVITAEATLQRAETAMAEAQTTFAGVNNIIESDIPGIMARLGTAIDDLGRTASGLEDFSRTGLPQFSALASEARALVVNIGTLANRIGSDPGRFLLGNQTPDYRR